MGKIDIKKTMREGKVKGRLVKQVYYKNEDFEKFNPEILRLGDIRKISEHREAIVAVYDLKGFTAFCDRVNSHLYVSKFLTQFFNWIFEDVAENFILKTYKRGKWMWASLPFLAKFMGDGVIFLWDSENMTDVEVCNVVVMARNTGQHYRNKLLPEIREDYIGVPNVLRCGIARGIVCSIGNGDDYVGPCINIASRLQKLSGLSFCFLRNGIEFKEGMKKETAAKIAVKSVKLRGMKRREHVCVPIYEYERLGEREKSMFKDV